MDDKPFDSVEDIQVEAPKPRKRSFKRKDNQAPKPIPGGRKHVVIATVPHCGAEFVIQDVLETTVCAQQSDYTLEEDSYCKWREAGGLLCVNLGELSHNNNHKVCEAMKTAEGIVYIHEKFPQRFREIATVEFAAGQPISEISEADTVTMDTAKTVNEAAMHVSAWNYILSEWHRIFPGEYISVSDLFPEKGIPYPHHILDSQDDEAFINRGARGWREMVKGSRTEVVNMAPDDIKKYLNKLPLYHNENTWKPYFYEK